ncbi:sensor histidine kinase [Chitinophaga tropicalis]|uniref:Sensor histidine kinase n=1 Tax=Chitinophaga tropicalis TaxID=2683588 RepID=A0A7K1U6N0_9BACT|nr:histidine kinase [Chitinophaga tropicalis]MVT10021.1 sensor histidine kinase [Chitinophaga tropicalis]
MSNYAENREVNKPAKGLVSGVSWQEIVAFLSLFVIMSLLYGMPRFIRGDVPPLYLRETAVDCLFMFISCIPPWWLHFRKLAHWPLKKLFWLHLPTSMIYYASWLLLYDIYNPLTGKPVITFTQVLLNAGPNLLFYVQIFSFLHIYHFFREREQQLKKEKELSSLAYNSEINALKAQIQPHFLFNTLNSISASVPPEQETTRELIAKLADTFRYALYVSQHEWVPLYEEAAFINTILELENRRFGKRLQFEIGSLKETGNVIVPSMLLQPLVENAIRHGIAPSLHGGKIEVDFERVDNKLKITVSDTGIGYPGNLPEILSAKGVGLRNARQRLELLFNETLYIERNHPGGMIFYFYIPIQYHVGNNSHNN